MEFYDYVHIQRLVCVFKSIAICDCAMTFFQSWSKTDGRTRSVFKELTNKFVDQQQNNNMRRPRSIQIYYEPNKNTSKIY